MSAIGDVARLAGVSKSTASRALSGGGYVSAATREKVMAAAAELGYVGSPAAASLVTGRSLTIAVLTPRVSRWFFGELLEGIEAALRSAGYDMTLYRVDLRSDDVFEYFLARGRCDGVIIASYEPTPSQLELLRRLGRPMVGVGGSIPGIPCVAMDDEGVARLATEHLLRLGHRDVAFIGGATEYVDAYSVPRNRRLGFTTAMDAAGLPHDESHFVEMTMPAGYAAAVQVLSAASRPTGIVAVSDEVAIGAIIASRRLGITVPNELSVIGIDGHENAEMFSLTTIEQNPREQGGEAVRILLDDVRSGEGQRERAVIHPTRLVVRNSTAAPAR